MDPQQEWPGDDSATAAPAEAALRTKIAHHLHWLDLYWLGLLPAFAIFGLFRLTHGFHVASILPQESGLAVLGLCTVTGLVVAGLPFAVMGYLMIVYGYTDLPESAGGALLALVDGPLLAFLSLPTGGSLSDYGGQAFLIDGLAVWISVLWLTFMQREVEVPEHGLVTCMASVAMLSTLGISLPYLLTDLQGQPWQIATLCAGVGWCTVHDVRRLALSGPAPADRVHMRPLLCMALLSLCALCLGLALRPGS